MSYLHYDKNYRGPMLHLIAILSFSTLISVLAYLIQHGEIEGIKNFADANNHTAIQSSNIHYLRTN